MARCFRVVWKPQGYECVEPSGSLKPGDRKALYCPQCKAKKCLFGISRPRLRAQKKKAVQQKSARKSRAMKEVARRKRARGLDSRGKPLAKSCWNCSHVRRDGVGWYVCRFEPDAIPVKRHTMSRARKVAETGCKWFGMRLYPDVLPLKK